MQQKKNFKNVLNERDNILNNKIDMYKIAGIAAH